MAISFVTSQGADSGGSSSVGCVMPGPVAVGDLLVTMLGWAATTTIDNNPTITDNLNVGAWNLPAPLHFTVLGINIEIVLGWIRCDTAGTPTVTASSLGTQGTGMDVGQYTGFVNSPALVSLDVTTNSGTSTSIAATGFTNSVANELIVAFATYGGGQNVGTRSGSFTDRRTGDVGTYYGDVVKASSGNALTFGATIGSAHWGAMLASFKDAPAGGANYPSPSQLFIMP